MIFITRATSVAIWGLASLSAAKTLVGIPTIDFDITSSATYSFSNTKSIVVDLRYKNTVDTDGKTLIPPSLTDFAHTFASDLAGLGVDVPVETASSAGKHTVFLTLASDPGTFLDAAGRASSEGYELTVSPSGVTISGASPLGVWWGTRTLLQQLKLGEMSLAIGTGTDAPAWGTRGVMLDVGRHYYPPEFIMEMCSYLSFWKQNTFHLHLSDNLFNNVDIYSYERSMDLYAAFRLNSDDSGVEGLVRSYRENETYTRDDFNTIQASCASRGVTIIPEIEAPGHALVIAQWKPELALDEDASLLNISHPDTIPTMKTIWQTFLPWFHSKTVHIGADEYDSSLADDYITFVNTMSDFIQESGRDIRIWGTYEPGTIDISRNITIQHWAQWERNPYWFFMKNGYKVLNSDDSFYIVGKWSGSYPQELNLTRIFNGNPAGGAWAPYVLDVNNVTNNAPRDDPLLEGHVAAQWNDYGDNATTVLEAYYSWRSGLAALADKQWGGNLTREQYETVFETLHSMVPAQNLDRSIVSKTDTILEYDFTKGQDTQVVDSSGNGYDGICHSCFIDRDSGVVSFCSHGYLTTPLSSKGRNYTLSFDIWPSSEAAIGSALFSGRDSTLILGNGTVPNVMLVSGNQPYSLNYTLPRDIWSSVKLIGRGNATFFSVNDDGAEMEFLAVLGINGASFQWEPIAIDAPLATIGGTGFVGSIKQVKLVGSA